MGNKYPTVDDMNPALPEGPYTMGIMVHSLLWVMQDLYHRPYPRRPTYLELKKALGLGVRVCESVQYVLNQTAVSRMSIRSVEEPVPMYRSSIS